MCFLTGFSGWVGGGGGHLLVAPDFGVFSLSFYVNITAIYLFIFIYLFISRFVHIEYIQVLGQKDIASPTRVNHLPNPINLETV